MPWTNQQLQSHLRAAKILDQIKNQSFEFIRKNLETTEYVVHQFIREKFKENKLWLPKNSPIVAFGKNTSHIHYFFKPKPITSNLKPEIPILIDLWSRASKKQSPFADITWMGFYGKEIPREFQKIFDIVVKSRDTCLNYLKSELKKRKIPTGAKLDAVVRAVITKAGYAKNFPHSTGHSLGFVSPHGKEAGLNSKNREPLEKNLGYTIEPGIYLKNKFGIRSEINFYIDNNLKLINTTEIQKKIVKI